ncbi:NAD(P)-binding protein [Clavulina sp. PMI_390]|nr:NAD(P)-binding protein [Clavulina sp. PMI_390]
MSYAVIQGSSKGIGLAITRHLLEHTKLRVVATSSQSSNAARDAALERLPQGSNAEERLFNVQLDVTDESSIQSAQENVVDKLGRNMRLLVNVSGILHAEKNLSEVDAQSLAKSFQINTFGHLLVYKHFVNLIPERQKKHRDSASIFDDDEEGDQSSAILPKNRATLVSFSARVGSIGDNRSGGWYSYRSSKAATNQVVRTLAHELELRKIPATAFAYHPGTVKTNLSEAYVRGKEIDENKGTFTTEMAARKFASVLRGGVQNGAFVDWAGKDVTW